MQIQGRKKREIKLANFFPFLLPLYEGMKKGEWNYPFSLERYLFAAQII
jgi:hypothetical protein